MNNNEATTQETPEVTEAPARKPITAPLNPNKKHRTMKKAQAKLDARLKEFEAMRDKSPKGSLYHKPGSLKK